MEATIEFPFAEQIESSDPAMMVELREMNDAWQSEGGLVPAAALGEIFGMHREGGRKLPARYGLTEYVFLGKKWYSMTEVKALHKIERPSGFKGHSVARMVTDCLDDAREN